MSRSGRHSAGALVLILFASVEAAAQYVPIRELDSNGSLTDEGVTTMAGAFAAGYALAANGGWDAVYWDGSGSHRLPLPSGIDAAQASACNENGIVVGNGIDTSKHPDPGAALVWSGGTVADLETLVIGGTAELWWPTDVDERGRILVLGSGPSRMGNAYLFEQGTLTLLPDLDPNPFLGGSTAHAMNEQGVIVGGSLVGMYEHAFVNDRGSLRDLHDPSFMKNVSVATAVNRHGWTVGGYGDGVPSLYWRLIDSFLWDGSTMVDLTATSPAVTTPAAINDFGLVVGLTFDPVHRVENASSWQDGVYTDLNSLIDPTSGWVLLEATDVDDEGRICGIGLLNGVRSAFLLEPECNGTFTPYGTGCPGSDGLEPRLRGAGCPAPGRDFALEVVDGFPLAVGLLFLGSGTGVVSAAPGCDIQVLPLVPPIVPLQLDALGEWWLAQRLPSGTPVFDLNLQAFFFDAGAAHGIAATKPLALHFE